MTAEEIARVFEQPVRDYATFVKVLTAYRLIHGLSQREVDELAGLDDGYVGKLENFDRSWGRVAGPISMTCWIQAVGASFLPIMGEPPSTPVAMRFLSNMRSMERRGDMLSLPAVRRKPDKVKTFHEVRAHKVRA